MQGTKTPSVAWAAIFMGPTLLCCAAAHGDGDDEEHAFLHLGASAPDAGPGSGAPSTPDAGPKSCSGDKDCPAGQACYATEAGWRCLSEKAYPNCAWSAVAECTPIYAGSGSGSGSGGVPRLIDCSPRWETYKHNRKHYGGVEDEHNLWGVACGTDHFTGVGCEIIPHGPGNVGSDRCSVTRGYVPCSPSP